MEKQLAQPRVQFDTQQLLEDYKLCVVSREVSLLARKEVYMGKAKFGIFGDGKELPQVVLARHFQAGDWRSGYYRDQTLMMALGLLTPQQYFAQLYAHSDLEHEPHSAGRQMNSHFATSTLTPQGGWKDLTKLKNSAVDLSPTAGQMPRVIGLGMASKLFRQLPELAPFQEFSRDGNEVVFATIGNASTSEGLFLEAVNAAGVEQLPVVFSVWDDDYGISVPNELHTVKSSISEALKGMHPEGGERGVHILVVKGWDYAQLMATYEKATTMARENHQPVLVHVTQLTQPQGHSTSGSHERYKTKERLAWEEEHDCNVQFRQWLLDSQVATEEELTALEAEAKTLVKQEKAAAWKAFRDSIKGEMQHSLQLIKKTARAFKEQQDELLTIAQQLENAMNGTHRDNQRAVKKALRLVRGRESMERTDLLKWLEELKRKNYDRFSSHLHAENSTSALQQAHIAVEYADDAPLVDGREVLNACFDAALDREPRLIAFGEDVGKIGDVNQAFKGLQEKYGALRVFDTGIRETSIIGTGIGAALRGLRPIAEIQYLDYLVYALMTLTDDLACMHYRSRGQQRAPMIVRTRGHRLEGVWHTGSPMSMMLGSLRGMYLCVPRNMTQAAGMYNILLKGEEPAVVVETLNAYRVKERLPANVSDFTVPLGQVEVLRDGTDITLVTYGAMCPIALRAAEELAQYGISLEVIDVQTLLPFDLNQATLTSIKKTNRVMFVDEDVPGGACAYMMQKVLEEQGAYMYLDASPRTMSAKAHRSAYANDGDYFSKPNEEDIFDAAYATMNEVNPRKYPQLY